MIKRQSNGRKKKKKCIHTNMNLHVCVFHREHVPKAREIYGEGRVEHQLAKGRVEDCIDCLFFPDLLIYCGVRADEIAEEIVDDRFYETYNNNMRMPILEDGVIIGVKNEAMYKEIFETDPNKFFKLRKRKERVD